MDEFEKRLTALEYNVNGAGGRGLMARADVIEDKIVAMPKEYVPLQTCNERHADLLKRIDRQKDEIVKELKNTTPRFWAQWFVQILQSIGIGAIIVHLLSRGS